MTTSEPTYDIIPTCYAVALKGHGAFSESAIYVRIEDEGAGTFVVVRSTSESEITNGQISLDHAALVAVNKAAAMLRKVNP